MARIGRQIPHYEFIDLAQMQARFSADKQYRYLLSMTYSDTLLDNSRNETAAVIMKNPSAADEVMADATIRKVETFIYMKFPAVRYLNILNIFAIRATDPSDVNAVFRKYGEENVIGPDNDVFIRETVLKSDYVITGWGNNSGIDKRLYSNRIEVVKDLLNQYCPDRLYYVSGNNKTKEPLHGLMWGYNYKLKKYPTDDSVKL